MAFAPASLTDVLGSPAWTPLAVVLALAAIVVSIGVYRKQRTRKGLSKEILRRSLVSVHAEAGDRISISYEGQPVRQVHLIEVALENTGNVPILAEDFKRPLEVTFGAGSPMTVEVAEKNPPNLEPAISTDGSAVRLEPLLLNPGDRMTIRALVRDFRGSVQVEHRIVGIAEITEAAKRPGRIWNRRLSRDWQVWVTATGAAAVALTTTATLTALIDNETSTRVVLRSGGSFCGHVRSVDARHVVIQLEDGGQLRTVPRAEVTAIQEASC